MCNRRIHWEISVEQARALTSVRKRKKILSLERTGCDATRSRKFSRPTLRLSTKSGSRLSADSLCHTNSACKWKNPESKLGTCNGFFFFSDHGSEGRIRKKQTQCAKAFTLLLRNVNKVCKATAACDGSTQLHHFSKQHYVFTFALSARLLTF